MKVFARVFFIIAAFQTAWAAQLAYIDIEGTRVLEAPRESGAEITTLKKGTPVAASNLPVEGFYKIKTKSGLVGWVSAQSLLLDKKPEKIPQEGEEIRPVQTSQSRQPTEKEDIISSRSELRIYGGLGLYNPEELSALTGVDGLGNGFQFGVGLTYWLGSTVGLGFRTEYLYKRRNATDETTSDVYRFTVSGIPLLAGVAFRFDDLASTQIRFYALGGYTLLASANYSVTTQSEPNSAGISSQALTAYGGFEVLFKTTSSFGFFIEGGYRYAKTGELVPDEAVGSVNGEELFVNADTGAYEPVPLDLSGIIALIGFTIDF